MATASTTPVSAVAPRRVPVVRRAASTASTASQATAAIWSTRTAMSAARCLTAWNWPMGRPNWTRTLAYSVAVSRHHRAPPACSAAIRATTTSPHPTRRRGRDSWRPGGHDEAAPPRPRPTRRVASRLGQGHGPDRAVAARVDQAPDHRPVAGTPAPGPPARRRPERRAPAGACPTRSTAPSGPGAHHVEAPASPRYTAPAVVPSARSGTSTAGRLVRGRGTAGSAAPRPPPSGAAGRATSPSRSPPGSPPARSSPNPCPRGPRAGGSPAIPASAMAPQTGWSSSTSTSSSDPGHLRPAVGVQEPRRRAPELPCSSVSAIGTGTYPVVSGVGYRPARATTRR